MRTLYLLSVWLHILAAATWVGGMVLFVIAVTPLARRLDDASRAAFFAAFGARLRVVTWTSLAILAATGILNMSARGVSLADFARPAWRASAFGQILSIKLALVALAVGICVVHERVKSRQAAKQLGRLTLLLGLAIIGAAVLLVRNGWGAESAATIAADQPGGWFVTTGCTSCHTVSVYGLSNPAASAPDLSIAIEEAPRRFGRPVESFLREPTGTMSMVLSGRIRLTDAQKAVALEELTRAYALYQQRQHVRPVSSH